MRQMTKGRRDGVVPCSEPLPSLALQPWEGPQAPGPVGCCSLGPGSLGAQEADERPYSCPSSPPGAPWDPSTGTRSKQIKDTDWSHGGQVHRHLVRFQSPGPPGSRRSQAQAMLSRAVDGWEHAGGVAGTQLGTAGCAGHHGAESGSPAPHGCCWVWGIGQWLRPPAGLITAGAVLMLRWRLRHLRLEGALAAAGSGLCSQDWPALVASGGTGACGSELWSNECSLASRVHTHKCEKFPTLLRVLA